MKGFWGFIVVIAFVGSVTAQTDTRVEIDLMQQRAYLIRGHRLLLESPISSGRYGHLTETGTFKVIEKEKNHFSSIYGQIVDASGSTIVQDADVDMKVPAGGKFVPAPMRYFMRFHEADGMHAGYLPGYAASHGCVRMPERMAIAFFDAVEVGTPVNVFGRTPRSNGYRRYGPRPFPFGPRNPWNGGPNDRVYDPRNPWWRQVIEDLSPKPRTVGEAASFPSALDWEPNSFPYKNPRRRGGPPSIQSC